jgi:hypothetical protein
MGEHRGQGSSDWQRRGERWGGGAGRDPWGEERSGEGARSERGWGEPSRGGGGYEGGEYERGGGYASWGELGRGGGYVSRGGGYERGGGGSERGQGRGGGYGGSGYGSEYARSFGGTFPEHGAPGGYGGRERAFGWDPREDWRVQERQRSGGEEDRGLLERMGDRFREGIERMKGRGPKGYKRSDERIREDVCERIARSGIDADEVEVKVDGGDVTLSGTVRSRQEKRWLEDVVDDVFGVDEVHNHLRLRREQERDAAHGEPDPALPH